MLASGWSSFRFRSAFVACGLAAGLALLTASPVPAQEADRIRPVTDAELENPSPDEWLMWRRTLDGWGYSPLDQVNRDNVADLRLVWSRALTPGRQQGTPLVRDGVLFMPNPRDVIQALDAVTGDLIWEHRRDRPDDLADYMIGTLIDTNRNIAIHGELIIDTSMDDHIFALHAETGEVVWDTEILDYRVNPANQTSGPIVAGGKVFSGRSCDPRGGPNGCVITAHDAATGEELWRRRLIPAPGEPGDETWGDVPFEERAHVGSWMVPSYDPELNLVYVGTSVTSPAPKYMLGGTDLAHLYHNSTLALDGDTGEIVWHYQHMNDHWDLDHPFERLLVDTAVRPDPSAVSWINPRLNAGEVRRVVTGIPGKTGIVYTLDRETGEFLWATPTITQNVVSGIDGATGAVTENAELIFTAAGQTVLACPHASGGKDWEAGAYSPRTNTMYMPLRNVCSRMMAMAAPDELDEARRLYAIAWRPEIAPGYDDVGSVQAISAETGQVTWNYPAAGRHDVAGRHRRRAGVRRRRERPLPGLRRHDGRDPLGDQPRLAGLRLPGHLRGRRPAVRGDQHRLRPVPGADPGAAPEQQQQPVRFRASGVTGIPDTQGNLMTGTKGREETMTRLTILGAAIVGLLFAGAPAPAAAQEDCAPDGDVQFVCGPVSPEDFAPVPDSPWVIVPNMVDNGPIQAVDTRDNSVVTIFPAMAGARHDRSMYGDCPGPVTSDIRPHGLNLRPGSGGRHTLLVVGHGARESIEVFELDATGSQPALTWTGCAVAPEGIGLNSVVALPEGGFTATSPATGDIWEWQSGAGWTRVPGSEDIGPNGIELSRDGEWYYVGGYAAQALIRLSRNRTPPEQHPIPVGHYIDNVRWGAGNTLLAAGHIGPTRASIGECIREDNCDGVSSRVTRIDLDSLTAEEVVNYPSNDLLLLGTAAIDVGDEIWVGQVAEGDRIARFPAP